MKPPTNSRFIISIILFSLLLGSNKTLVSQNVSPVDSKNKYSGFAKDTIYKYQKFIYNGGNASIKGGDISRYAFLNFTQLHKHAIIKKGASVKAFETRKSQIGNFVTISRFGKLPLKEYIKKDAIDGMLIIHKGKIVFETYPRMFKDDVHLSFSVSKVFASTAIALLEDRGLVDVNQSIDFYFKALKGSAWEGVCITDILAMSSGIDPKTDRDLIEKTGWPESGNAKEDIIKALVTSKKGPNPAGTAFEYIGINTAMLGFLVEKLSGLKYSYFLEKEIWQKLGTEAHAYMLQKSYGRDMPSLGMSFTLRDLARFGFLFTPSGRKEGKLIISNSYLKNIQNASEKLRTKSYFGSETKRSAYQWDEIYDDGDFAKFGHAGQGIYIAPKQDFLIAFFGTYTEGLVQNELPLICRQISKSGVFKN